MTSCLDDIALLEIAEGRRAFDAEAQAHLSVCGDCRLVLASGARGRNVSTAHTLEDPGDLLRDEPSWDELGAGVVVGGRYELERFLGAGSMGVVWMARRLPDLAPFALKIARSLGPDVARRFEREARVIARLDHPSIVPLVDSLPATPSRGPCLVLPLLTGEPLESALARRHTLSLAETARLVVAIADALAYAHAKGVVHRDLKPQNVFLTAERVMLLDFGIAKLMPDWGTHSRLTKSGAVVGTLRYMAPEQLFGEPDVDARSDIWALGVMLFRALAGRGPIEGDTARGISAGLRNERVDDLAGVVPDVPADVAALASHALVIPRERRLADVREFTRVMTRYVV